MLLIPRYNDKKREIKMLQCDPFMMDVIKIKGKILASTFFKTNACNGMHYTGCP